MGQKISKKVLTVRRYVCTLIEIRQTQHAAHATVKEFQMFKSFYNQFVNAGIAPEVAKKAACMAAKTNRTPDEQAFVNQILQQIIQK